MNFCGFWTFHEKLVPPSLGHFWQKKTNLQQSFVNENCQNVSYCIIPSGVEAGVNLKIRNTPGDTVFFS